MPQDHVIPVVFPYRVNPDPVRASLAERQWMETYGVTGKPQRLRKLIAVEPAKLIVYTYPDAHGANLDLAVEMNCTFFYLDDLIDEVCFERPAEAAALIEAIVTQMYPDRPSGSEPPHVAAFRDVWDRSVAGMSTHWRLRNAALWSRYLWANLTEATNRRLGAVPTTIENYLQERRHSIGVAPSLGMVERTSGFELPACAYHQTDIQQLETLTSEIIALCNDIASLEKEEAQGDTYNAVVILYTHGGLTRDQALDRVDEMVSDRANEFYRVSPRIPALCDALDLSVTQRASVYRWVDGARNWIGGNLAWQRETPRYQTAHPNQPARTTTDTHRPDLTKNLVWHTSPFHTHQMTPG
jgi:hypothetical protein